MMNGQTKILTLEDTVKGGAVVSGITNPAVNLQEGDQFVSATIHLDHLSKDDVLELIRIIKPYDNNLELKTAKDLKAGVSLGGLRLNSEAGLQAPGVQVNGLNGQINAPNLNHGISTPTVNAEMPQMELKNATPNFSYPGFKKPTFGMSTSNLEGAGLDGKLEGPNVSVSTPSLNTPDLAVNVDKTELKTSKFKMPNFNLPAKKPKVNGDVNLTTAGINADLKTPDLSLSAPKINGEMNTPEVDMALATTEFSGPNLDIETPKVNIEPHSKKFKFHKIKKTKTPKVKVPEASVDANLNTPNLALSAPKLNADVSAPNFHNDLPRANLETPDIDIKTPGVDIGAPSGKIDVHAPSAKHKFSTFKMPKLNIHKTKLKTPDLNAGIQASDLSAPRVDMNLPKAELEGPNLDVKAPNLNLSGPDLDIKTPAVDVQAPDIDIETPSGKLKKPHVKLPKINLSGTKMKGPDVDLNAQADFQAPDLDLKAPDLCLSAPKLEGKLSGPDVDLNLPDAHIKSPNVDLEAPDIDINAPKIDIDAPSGKAKLPHLKFPKFGLSGPRVKTPKLDAPDVDMKIPTAELKGPDVDVQTPDLSLSMPKVEGGIAAPPLDIHLPKADLKAPTVNIGGKSPNLSTPDVDINLPKAEHEWPDAKLKVPDVDINATSGKFKMPHFNLPKLNLSEPKVKGPELDANADIDFSVPKLEGELTDLNLPKAEISVPDVNATLPKAEVSVPSVDVSSPDLKAPSGKLKPITFKKSKVDLSGPKVKGPGIDLNAEAPDISLSAPTVDTDFKVPDADIKLPTADVDINTPKGKLKLPTLKKFHLTSPKVKSPDVDIAADVSGPDLNLSAPEVGNPDVNVSLPNAGVDLDVPTADVDITAPKGKLKFPTLKKFNQSGPKVKSPDVDIAADVSGPDLNLSAPEVGGPDVDLSLPNAGVDVDVPGINAEAEGSKHWLKWPFKWRKSVESNYDDINIKAPEVDGTTSEIKLPKNIPIFKTHSLPPSNIDSILQEYLGAADNSTDPTKTITDTVISVSSVKTNMRASSPSVGVNGQAATVDVLERLRLSNARTTSPDFDIPSEGGSPTKVNRGTFKVTKPDTEKDYPVVDTTSKEDDAKMNLSLNNMLCLTTD